jgi:hypothetical protein
MFKVICATYTSGLRGLPESRSEVDPKEASSKIIWICYEGAVVFNSLQITLNKNTECFLVQFENGMSSNEA